MKHAKQTNFDEYLPKATWKTRTEAADYLGLSVRCLDHYAKHPDKGPKFIRWRRRCWYAVGVLDAFKAKMASDEFIPYRRDVPFKGPRPAPELVREEPDKPAAEMDGLAEEFCRLSTAMEALATRLRGLNKG